MAKTRSSSNFVREGGDKYTASTRTHMRIKPTHVDVLQCHTDSNLTLMLKHTWYITSCIISSKQLQLLQLMLNIIRAAKVRLRSAVGPSP